MRRIRAARNPNTPVVLIQSIRHSRALTSEASKLAKSTTTPPPCLFSTSSHVSLFPKPSLLEFSPPLRPLPGTPPLLLFFFRFSFLVILSSSSPLLFCLSFDMFLHLFSIFLSFSLPHQDPLSLLGPCLRSSRPLLHLLPPFLLSPFPMALRLVQSPLVSTLVELSSC